jgi:rRNA maturation endonuclease Nob1
MGFFNQLGRKVEGFKQDVETAKADEATHRCTDCGELFYSDHDACSECGGDVVER